MKSLKQVLSNSLESVKTFLTLFLILISLNLIGQQYNTNSKYDEVPYKRSYFLNYVQKNGLFDSIGDWKLNIKKPSCFGCIGSYSDGLTLLKERFEYKMQAYYDQTGKVILSSFIDPKNNKRINFSVDKYDLGDFSEGYATIRYLGYYKEPSGFINKQGVLTVPLKYDCTYPVKEGMACVILNKKYGFINPEGVVKIPLNFDEASSFNEGLAAINLKGKWGYINQKGNFVILPTFNSALDFNQGLARIEVKGKYGFIDKKGKKIIDCIYDFATNFIDSVAIFRKGNKWGIVESNGVELIDDLDYCFEINEHRLLGYKSNNYFILDRRGVKVNSENYDYLDIISPDRIIVKKGKFYGYLNKYGLPMTNLIYEEICGKKFFDPLQDQKETSWFLKHYPKGREDLLDKTQDLLMFTKNGKYGLMTYLGRELTPPIYDDLIFKNGIISGKINNSNLFLNQFGNELIVGNYDEIWDFGDGLDNITMVSKTNNKGERKFGFIDIEGTEVIPPIYDVVREFYTGRCIVGLGQKHNWEGGKYGVINKKNEIIIPIEYDADELVLGTNNLYTIVPKIKVQNLNSSSQKKQSSVKNNTTDTDSDELANIFIQLFIKDIFSSLSNNSSSKVSNNNINKSSRQNGQWINCKDCHGTGLKVCYSCDGKGQKECRRCYGSGTIDKGTIFSPDTNGRGHTCPECAGRGTKRCSECYGKGNSGNCYTCDGRGQVKS